MKLTDQLRAATGPIHTRIESLPLARAMAQGEVDREDYLRLLRQLLMVHQLWGPEASLSSIWVSEMGRIDAIQHDLAALGAEPEALDHPSFGTWVAALRERAEVDPEVWIGVIYLFEGSRMGSLAMARPIARALGVPPLLGHGLDYHLDGASGRGPRWARFKATLDSPMWSISQQQAIVWGAMVTFEMLFDLYSTSASLISIN